MRRLIGVLIGLLMACGGELPSTTEPARDVSAVPASARTRNADCRTLLRETTVVPDVQPREDVLIALDPKVANARGPAALRTEFSSMLKYRQYATPSARVGFLRTDPGHAGELISVAAHPDGAIPVADTASYWEAYDMALQAGGANCYEPLIAALDRADERSFPARDSHAVAVCVRAGVDDSPRPGAEVRALLLEGFDQSVGIVPLGSECPVSLDVDTRDQVVFAGRESSCAYGWSNVLEKFGARDEPTLLYWLTREPVPSSVRVFVESRELERLDARGAEKWRLDRLQGVFLAWPFLPAPGSELQFEYQPLCPL